MRHKLGRLPAQIPLGLRDVTEYQTAPLPVPPRSKNYGAKIPVNGWGMDGNDRLGDCTIAGWVHLLLLFNMLLKSLDAIPTEAQIEAEYKFLTGGPDTGLVLADVLRHAQRTGLFGHKIKAYAPVNIRNHADVLEAVDAYGAIYLGVNLPQSAEDQFNAGHRWTYVGDDPVGGHCIVIVGWDPKGVRIVTWGRELHASWEWFDHYVDEGWIIVPAEVVEVGHGVTGLDVTALLADLASV